jgi:hypothetical protein
LGQSRGGREGGREGGRAGGREGGREIGGEGGGKEKGAELLQATHHGGGVDGAHARLEEEGDHAEELLAAHVHVYK